MLHALKRKTVGGFQARKELQNVEFASGKQRLQQVESALKKGLSYLEESHSTWNSISDGTVLFCEGLHSLYPEEDELQTMLQQTLEKANALDLDTKAESNDEKREALQRIIWAYLDEIKDIRGQYDKVEVARKEYGMSAHRIDKLGGKSVSKEKREKYAKRMEMTKEEYDDVLKEVVQRLSELNKKAPAMFKAIFVAYWARQEKCMNLVSDHCTAPMSYASANEDSVFDLTKSSSFRSNE